MKNLQNYKIEPQGLNEAILHKAVEEGYDSDVNHPYLLETKYLYLYTDGCITWSDSEMRFKDRPFAQISAHDFLRLNWTPKVGEEVECVRGAGNWGIMKGEIYTVKSIGTICDFITVNDNYFSFSPDRFIPVYPKKQLRFKTEQEFIEEFGEVWRNHVEAGWNSDGSMDYLFGKPYPDTSVGKPKWSISDCMLTDKPLPELDEKPDAYINEYNSLKTGYCHIIFRENGNNKGLNVPIKSLHQYNLLSESDYKAKYDKLMFKNWEVAINGDNLKIGCIEMDAEPLRYLYKAVKDSPVKPSEIGTTTIMELMNFMTANKIKLGL